MSITICPQFTELDSEITQDFCECLQENIDQIENCINLLDTSEDVELIHHLFRDVHSLKGNCRMVFLEPLVEVIHALEDIVSDMRQGLKTYVPFYGEFIMAIVVRINNMIHELRSTGEIAGKPHVTMLKVITDVHSCQTGKDIEALNKAMDTLVGYHPTKVDKSISESSTSSDMQETDNVDHNDDLAFFRRLSLQLDELNIHKSGRTQSVLDLCLSTNENLGSPVNIEQLTAAVYLHDIGMPLLPPDILNKPSQLKEDEFEVIKNHVDMGTQLLTKIKGWSDAADIVNQHHEKYDGSGYPRGLKQDEIHPGAMILALADTFYAVTNKRVDRSLKKSLFCAISLINDESGVQFKPDFVEAFNEAIRHHYIARKKTE